MSELGSLFVGWFPWSLLGVVAVAIAVGMLLDLIRKAG